MKILKYTPLFFIYYIFNPNDRESLFKSLLFNVVVIIIVAASVSVGNHNVKIMNNSIRNNSNINSDLRTYNNLQSDLDELNSENKELLNNDDIKSNNDDFSDDQNISNDIENSPFFGIYDHLTKIQESNSQREDFILLGMILISKESTELNIPIYNKEELDKLFENKYDKASELVNKISANELTESQIEQIDYSIDKIKNNETFILDSVDSTVNNIIKAYYKAISLEEEIDKLKKSKPNKINYSDKPQYYWQQPLYNNLNNKEKKQITGELGEVGYKGLFPIFIQGDPVDKLSKLPWKFQGENTTLGESACSLYSLCSLLTAAGYSDKNIPNTNDKPNIITLKRYFANGPITWAHVNQYYDVKIIPTSTKDGQDRIFEDLLLGIPYVVNVRNGTVTAYLDNGEITKTIFTSRGHFMIMDKAKEENGKRYVSLIQSSRSNASLWGLDQNNAWFDYDEIIDKKVLRSSQGNAVPAYTVVGGKNLPQPLYLDINNTVRKHDILNHKEDNRWIKELMDEFDININETMVNGAKIEAGKVLKVNKKTVIDYINNDIIIFISKENAIMITDLQIKSTLTGMRKPNAMLGTTGNNSKLYIVQRVDENQWEVMLSDEENN